MYFTYVLFSSKFDRIYVGQTKDLKIRLAKHNSGKVKSTKPYIPWEIIFDEPFQTRSEAMKRERELKSHQGRNFIRKSILNK